MQQYIDFHQQSSDCTSYCNAFHLLLSLFKKDSVAAWDTYVDYRGNWGNCADQLTVRCYNDALLLACEASRCQFSFWAKPHYSTIVFQRPQSQECENHSLIWSLSWHFWWLVLYVATLGIHKSIMSRVSQLSPHTTSDIRTFFNMGLFAKEKWHLATFVSWCFFPWWHLQLLF